MKKLLSVLAVSVLMFSCTGFGGDKINGEDTNSRILQAMLICQKSMEAELEKAMYEENYVFAGNTATMNVKFSSSCGLKTTERTAYEAELNKWTVEEDLYLTTGDLEKDNATACKITVTGKVKGSVSVSRWTSAASTVEMGELVFGNDDSDGLAVTIYNTDTEKNVFSAPVFVLTEVKISKGAIGGHFKLFSRINSAEYEAPSKIWTNIYNK